MNVGLGIAGLSCVGLALGHTTVGLVWVLPSLEEARLPSTPFGPPSMTAGMVRVTWHIVTLFCLAFAGVLMTLALAASADPKTVVLRWFAAGFLAATALVFLRAGVRLRYLLRLPVWSLWVVVAVLCWKAST